MAGRLRINVIGSIYAIASVKTVIVSATKKDVITSAAI